MSLDFDPTRQVVEPRPAATVALLRSGANGQLEVLLMQRTSRMTFMANAWVFPGGRVDDEDRRMVGDAMIASPPSLESFAFAAKRECKEEVGIDLDAVDAPLSAWSRWITPTAEKKRFDTQFFVAWLEEGDLPLNLHEGEVAAAEWISIPEALARFERFECFLAPPTWHTLYELSKSKSHYDLQTLLSSRGNLPVTPEYIATKNALALPGDSWSTNNSRVLEGPTRFVAAIAPSEVVYFVPVFEDSKD